MRKAYWVVLFLCLMFTSVKAQKTESPDQKERIPVLSAKFCFEPLFNIYTPAIQAGFEYRFRPQSGWHNELGYILNLNRTTEDIDRLNGFKLATEYRFYFGKTLDTYLGFATRYKLWATDRSGTFLRDGGAYRQRLDYFVRQQTVSFNLSFGYENLLFNKVYLGVGMLLGRGARFQKTKGIPEDAEYVVPSGLFPFRILERGDQRGIIDFAFRFHLGYLIK